MKVFSCFLVVLFQLLLLSISRGCLVFVSSLCSFVIVVVFGCFGSIFGFGVLVICVKLKRIFLGRVIMIGFGWFEVVMLKVWLMIFGMCLIWLIFMVYLVRFENICMQLIFWNVLWFLKVFFIWLMNRIIGVEFCCVVCMLFVVWVVLGLWVMKQMFGWLVSLLQVLVMFEVVFLWWVMMVWMLLVLCSVLSIGRQFFLGMQQMVLMVLCCNVFIRICLLLCWGRELDMRVLLCMLWLF